MLEKINKLFVSKEKYDKLNDKVLKLEDEIIFLKRSLNDNFKKISDELIRLDQAKKDKLK